MKLDKEFTLPSAAEVSIIPVMQGEGLQKIDESELPAVLPILALRNAVLFPGAVFPITIGREKSIKLIGDGDVHALRVRKRNRLFLNEVPQLKSPFLNEVRIPPRLGTDHRNGIFLHSYASICERSADRHPAVCLRQRPLMQCQCHRTRS